MRRVLSGLAIVLVLGGYHDGAVSAQETIVGHWVGVASRQGAELPIEFDFQNDGKGLTGFVTARTLAAMRISLMKVSHDAPNVRFELPTDFSTFQFTGTVVGNSLTGSWNLFGFDSNVSMSRTVAEPAPYSTGEVSCNNGNVTLAGTLFIPMSRDIRHPAIVFVHGSGTAPRQAFNFLADQFTRLGVASLIFDKRGSGASTGNWREADFSDLARDVLACVQVLQAHGQIDATKIGLFGQSQGGWVAPLAASLSRDIAFIILVSGAPMTPARQGWWEAESKLRKRGFGQGEIDRARSLWEMHDGVTRTGQGFAEFQTAVERVKGEPWLAALGLANPPPIDSPFRRFYRRIMDFDPLPVLENVSVPSLWIYGGRDEIVPSIESTAIVEKVKARGKDITVRSFPMADHALWTMPQDGEPFRWPGLASGYLDFMSNWLSRRVSAKN